MLISIWNGAHFWALSSCFEGRSRFMTNKNDNRERRNKYPRNKTQDTEFNKETDIRSEITKKDLKSKKSN